LLFLAEFVLLAWAPADREAWLLENLISFPVALLLLAARDRLPFSATSWFLIFAFLAFHEIGSHYTYSEVPWQAWCRDLLGWDPGWQRNHYDRFAHFLFGLLMTRPIAELLTLPLPNRSRMVGGLSVCLVLACSSVYELLEWGAASMGDPQIGIAFVGAQGDLWDAQKDMALALAGSCMSVLIGVGIRFAKADRG